MQHSLLDRIYLAFLLILIVSFGFLIFFISYFTRKSLIKEKKNTITNEAQLIASQAISSYANGNMNAEELSNYFDYYAETLHSDIWYLDEGGTLIASAVYVGTDLASSDAEKASSGSASISILKHLPTNIYELDMAYDIHSNYYTIGTFYGIYSNNVISVNTPITFTDYTEKGKSVPYGALIIHTSSTDINEALRNIYTISFIPCLIIIVIAFALLQIIFSLRPIELAANFIPFSACNSSIVQPFCYKLPVAEVLWSLIAKQAYVFSISKSLKLCCNLFWLNFRQHSLIVLLRVESVAS